MSRTPKKRRKKPAPRAKPPRKPNPKTKKRKPKKRSKKSRSAAAKRGWEKRRKRDRLVTAMRAKGWRESELPTSEELLDYLSYLADKFEVEISDMYRMYFGYEVGEAAE
jgi:hypothetical protein